MSQFKIFIETGTDLSRKYILSDPGLYVMPLNIIVDGREYKQDAAHPEMLTPVFYEGQRKGKRGEVVSLHAQQIIDHMRPVLQAGEDILYLGLDDILGGNFSAAQQAVKQLQAEYPQRRVLVVDTGCVSLGQGRLVELCNEYAKAHSLEQTYDFAIQKARHIHHLFMVDDPRYLRRFHQVNMLIGWWQRFRRIKPIYEITKEGYMTPYRMPRTTEKALAVLTQRVLDGHRKGKVYIAHADNLATAGKLRAMLCKRNQKLTVEIGDIGPAVGIRCGAGTVAVFYEGVEKSDKNTDC